MSKIIYFSQKCLGPCENNRECVQCETFGGKNKNCDCDIKSTIVDRIDDYDNEYKKCQFVDQTDNCTFFFSYSKSNDKMIKVQKTKGINYFINKKKSD